MFWMVGWWLDGQVVVGWWAGWIDGCFGWLACGFVWWLVAGCSACQAAASAVFKPRHHFGWLSVWLIGLLVVWFVGWFLHSSCRCVRDCLVDCLVGCMVAWLADSCILLGWMDGLVFYQLIGQLVAWMVSWFNGRLLDWMAGWMNGLLN